MTQPGFTPPYPESARDPANQPCRHHNYQDAEIFTGITLFPPETSNFFPPSTARKCEKRRGGKKGRVYMFLCRRRSTSGHPPLHVSGYEVDACTTSQHRGCTQPIENVRRNRAFFFRMELLCHKASLSLFSLDQITTTLSLVLRTMCRSPGSTLNEIFEHPPPPIQQNKEQKLTPKHLHFSYFFLQEDTNRPALH